MELKARFVVSTSAAADSSCTVFRRETKRARSHALIIIEKNTNILFFKDWVVLFSNSKKSASIRSIVLRVNSIFSNTDVLLAYDCYYVGLLCPYVHWNGYCFTTACLSSIVFPTKRYSPNSTDTQSYLIIDKEIRIIQFSAGMYLLLSVTRP